jgi:serine/threonine protein kinase
MQDFFQKYETLSTLGNGSTSTVLLARDRITGERVAVKKMEHSAIFTEDIEREIFAMERLQAVGKQQNSDAQYIVHLKEVFRSASSTFLVMDLVPGCTLFDIITNSGVAGSNSKSKRERVIRLTCQLAAAISHVHTNGLLHLDLKPDNVLVSSRNPEKAEVRLADFGSSAFQLPFTDVCARSNFVPAVRRMKLKTKRARGTISLYPCSSGTAAYWSPEMIACKDASKCTDMWALGCIIYILVTGKHPFDRCGRGDLRIIKQSILEDEVLFIDREWAGMEDLKEITSALLCKDKRERMTGEELRNHPALTHSSFGATMHPPACSCLSKTANLLSPLVTC